MIEKINIEEYKAIPYAGYETANYFDAKELKIQNLAEKVNEIIDYLTSKEI